MMSSSVEKSDFEDSEKPVPIEAALDEIGFGLYGVLQTCLTTLILFSFTCVAYGSTFIVPTSACELATTTSQQGVLAAGPLASLLVGGVIWSYLADTHGRRKVLLIGLTGGVIFNMIATISVNWIMLLIFQIIATFFTAGYYSVSHTILSECIPMRSRNTAILVVASVMLPSQGLMALLAIPIIPLTFSYYLPSLGIYWNSWRTLMLVFCIPNIICVIFLFFMQESPKFLLNKGLESKALETLETINRINNYWKSEKPLRVKHLLQENDPVAEEKQSVLENIIPLFKAPLLKYTIIMAFMNLTQQIAAFMVWMPTIADQMVRTIQTGERSDLTVCELLRQESGPINPDETPCALDETSLLIVLAVGLSLAIFNLLVTFAVNYVGRRNMFIAIVTVSGISGILVNLVPNIIGSSVLFLIMILGGIVLGLCTAICIALYPTNLRAFAIAFTMVSQYVGIIISVQVLNLLLEVNCDAGFYIFASLFSSAAIAAFFLPNDLKKEDTESSPSDLASEDKTEF